MTAVVAMLAIVVGLFALVWWGAGGPPTRPRPGSRYRGTTFLDVDRRLRRAQGTRRPGRTTGAVPAAGNAPRSMSNRSLPSLGFILLGVLFVAAAIYYATTATSFLASDFGHHDKHAVLAAALGVLSFVGANFARHRGA